MMANKIITLFIGALSLSLLASCGRAGVEMSEDTTLSEILFTKGDAINDEPITEAQWDELKIAEGIWVLDYCYKKILGNWEERKDVVIRYEFHLPDKVEEYESVHAPGPGDGGSFSRITLDWRYDASESSLTIGDETFSVYYSGKDSFFLLKNVRMVDPESGVSLKLCKFSRARG